MTKRTTYYSQFQQDRFVNDLFFKNKTDGLFLDIGAHNGISLSNTYFFEKCLDWKGLCIEPIPEIYQELQKNRHCICIEGCIAQKTSLAPFFRVYGPSEMLSGLIDQYDPRHRERIEIELRKQTGSYREILVPTFHIHTLLEKHHIEKIDFLSLDTEGGELEILKSINYQKYSIDVITVENNFQDPSFQNFLFTKRYLKAANLGCDEIYKKM